MKQPKPKKLSYEFIDPDSEIGKSMYINREHNTGICSACINAEDEPELGTCCQCGTADGVRNILMLSKRAPIAGRGWGCVVCNLPADGATAVVCDPCLEALDGKTPRLACRGYPALDGRIEAELLTTPFTHDEGAHRLEGEVI